MSQPLLILKESLLERRLSGRPLPVSRIHQIDMTKIKCLILAFMLLNLNCDLDTLFQI